MASLDVNQPVERLVSIITIGEEVVTMRKTGELEALAKSRGVSIKELIIEAYNCHGSIRDAAESLGVNRNTFTYYMNRSGIRIERVVRAA